MLGGKRNGRQASCAGSAWPRSPATDRGHARLRGGLRCALRPRPLRHLARESARATAPRRPDGIGLVAVLYRPDRVRRPRTALPVQADPARCRLVRRSRRPQLQPPGPAALPARATNAFGATTISTMWSSSSTTTSPRPRPGAAAPSSSISPHRDFAPTAGCVAVTEKAMRRLLARVGPADRAHRRLTLAQARSPKIALPTDIGRAEGDRRLEIAAHPHRQRREPEALGDLGEQREMRRRRFLERRDAHQPVDREAMHFAAAVDECVGFLRQDARLLRLRRRC